MVRGYEHEGSNAILSPLLPPKMNALSGRSNTPGADPISQFLQIKKQCQKDNLKAEDSLEIIADDKRAYFPTQTVQARVRVNDALMSDGCQIKAEFRGKLKAAY